MILYIFDFHQYAHFRRRRPVTGGAGGRRHSAHWVSNGTMTPLICHKNFSSLYI
jgi:hypothetical protein